MTVLTQTNKMAPQAMNGVATVFTFTFRALVDFPEAIKIVILNTTNDVETFLTYGSDYTVAINSDGIGGTITVSNPQNNDYTLTIYREYEITQESNYADYNSFPAETVEDGYDKDIMINQQQEEVIDRTLQLPITSTGIDNQLPLPIPNFLLGWNPAGDAIVNIDPASIVPLPPISDFSFLLAFTNADLSGGILNVAHNLGATYVVVSVFDNNNLQITPDEITLVDDNNLTVDLTTFGAIAGTWRVVVLSAGSNLVSPASTKDILAFTNADLSGGVLVHTHNLGEKYVEVQIYNNLDKLVQPDQITLASINATQIDLTSFGVIAGTWRSVIHN